MSGLSFAYWTGKIHASNHVILNVNVCMVLAEEMRRKQAVNKRHTDK